MPVIQWQNKAIWLWLRERGGFWTVHDIARRTGIDADAVFAAVHAMSRDRRGNILQVGPLPGDRRKRYGVTDDCIIPLGLTVAEASAGSRSAPPAPRAAAVPIAMTLPATEGLSPAERAYAHMTHRLEGARA